MSLTNRVCMFFLGALAIILAIYSLVLYSVTREHINSQFENGLRGVLNSLIAAAEVEETEVKWQPVEHSIDFGTHDEFGEIQWVVVGDDDLIVERSRYADDEFMSRVMLNAKSGVFHKSTLATTDTSDGLTMLSQQVSAPRPEHSELDFCNLSYRTFRTSA